MTTCVNEEAPARSTMSNSTTDLLRGLPYELLYHIGDLLSPKSLNNLARTSKSISSVYIPRLYRQHDRLASQWAAENGETDTARRDMQYSKDPKGQMDEILLPTAVVKGHEDLVKLLISEGADLTRLDDGQPLLAAAALYNHVNIVKLLISHGVDINQQSSFDTTALAMARHSNKSDVITFLVQQERIDLSYETNGGIDVFQVAIERGYCDVVEQLLQRKTYRDARINTWLGDHYGHHYGRHLGQVHR